MSTRIVISALGIILCGAAFAAAEDLPELAKRTEAREYKLANGGVFRYRWVEPKSIETGKRYPLVILMHGAGERGTDNLNQLVWGAKEILDFFKEKNEPFYFVAGQVPNGKRWVEVNWALLDHQMPAEPSETMAAEIEFVSQLLVNAPIDRSRVYVTGISMGGYGTWDLLCRKPEWFAAAMPICGGADVSQAWKLRDIPIWIHHGDCDTVVPFVRSRKMTTALWAVDGKVKYTEYPGVGHGSWIPAYGTKKNLEWLFSQRKAKANTVSPRFKTPGLIGGMGPSATCDLMKKVIDLTEATDDQHNIHMLVDQNTDVPDRTAAILKGGADPVPQLTASARRLEAEGADFLCMSCNTAHYFHSKVQAAVSIPVLHMPRESAKELKRRGIKRVGLLATDGTIKTRVYHNVVEAEGIEVIVPDAEDQQTVMHLIYGCVKKNVPVSEYPKAAVEKLIANLKAKGAEAFLLACTELPIAFDNLGYKDGIVDPTECLARAIVREAGAPLRK